MEPRSRNELSMGLLRKKRNVEGWSDSVAETGRLAVLRESFRNSTRAWLVSMIGVILIGVCAIFFTLKNEQMLTVKVTPPHHSELGVYDDEAHRHFISEFNAVMGRRGVKTDFVFQNAGRIKIVVSDDVSNDDIVFLSSWAARAVNTRFHTAPYVYVFTRDNATPPHEKQVAITQWVNHRNDFVVSVGTPQNPNRPATE
jgi:hypothetical protein